MKIFRSLEGSSLLTDFEVLDYKKWNSGFYVKIKALLHDGTTLFIREYCDSDSRDYSFHWQDTLGNILCRWNNSPHHPHLKTFPHHKHEKNEIKESSEITLDDVLKEITEVITKNSNKIS